MPVSELLLPEFDQEMAITRRVLERVPDDRPDWKPHPKSFSVAHLAQLIARLPSWVSMTLQKTELDLNPPGGSTFVYSNEKTSTLLAEFDRNVAEGRKALAAASDDDMNVPWTLKRSGQALMTLPRYSVLRGMVINHIVHHRAQMTVYLRLLEIPVPSTYGPTADEKM